MLGRFFDSRNRNHQSLKQMDQYIPVRRRLAERLPTPHRLQIEPDRISQAAVTLLLRERGDDDEILIIKRAERAGDPWSGHLALPGGRAQAEDADLLITAARETLEEVGVDLLGSPASRDRFIGQLPLLAPHNPSLPRIEITPLVAVAPDGAMMSLSHEVEMTFWISVNRLKAAGRSAEYRLHFGDYVRKWPAYPSLGGPIWGITERILTDFLTLLDE